jgi:hypothetical protein
VADEEIFRGARIVRSAGHLAQRGFRDGESDSSCLWRMYLAGLLTSFTDRYTPSQLIMISENRLAQFWEGFGHVSYYQRVDLEALMKV